jgi:ligand-binding sensor domain-containing protein
MGAVPLSRLQSVRIGASRELLTASLGGGAGVLTRSGGYAITRADSLLDDIVFDVCDGADGARYFATHAGLCAQLDDTTFAWYQAGSGLPRGEARELAVGDDGAVYVLVSRRGIYRFGNGRAARVSNAMDIPLSDALSISAGADGSVWAAGQGWAAVRRRGNWTRVDAGPDGDKTWRTVVADGAGAFLGSADGVVLAVERGGAWRADLGEGLPAPRVEAIAPDGSAAAWLVCGGYILRADLAARRVVVENVPPDTRAVTISPSGEVFAAGRWTVRRRDPAGWTDLDPDVIGSDPAFTAARADAGGALWVGTRSGAIYRYDGDIWLRMARGAQAFDGGGITEVRSERGGTWAVGAGIAVKCVDGGVQRFNGIDETEAVVDLERSDSGEWVALTARHLYVFDDDARQWRARTPASMVGGDGDEKPAGRYTALAFAGPGTLCLGTTDGLGVVTAEGTRWLRAVDGIGGGSIGDLVVDGETLWIGFATDGFSVLPLAGLR